RNAETGIARRRDACQRDEAGQPNLDSEQLGVNSHPHNGVRPQRIQRVDLLLAANATCHNELQLRELAQARGSVDRKALHHSLSINMCVKECSGVGLELWNGFVGWQ